MLVKALTMTYWGKLTKTFGNKNLMRVSSVLVALIPLGYVSAGLFFKGTPYAFWAVLAGEIISGFAWAGLELTTFNYMLEHSSQRTRAKLFAYFGVALGTAVIIGGLAGSALLNVLQHIPAIADAFIIVFGLSAFIRLTASIMLIPSVPDIGNHPSIEEGKLFYEVLIARPLGRSLSPAVNKFILDTPLARNMQRNISKGRDLFFDPLKIKNKPKEKKSEKTVIETNKEVKTQPRTTNTPIRSAQSKEHQHARTPKK
jgi:MFS family permease